MQPDGSGLLNLSNNPADDTNPAFSPDGSQIAFVSNRDAEEGGQSIYVMNADGSQLRQLTFDHWSNWPAWSPDGTQITYTSSDDIFIINADGSGQPVNLTNSPEKDEQSSWSPVSQRIAWVSDKNIFTMDPDGSHVTQLTFDNANDGVRWTVDGRLYTMWNDHSSACNNCIMDADGTNLGEAGGKGEMQRHFPFFTPDGKRVECVSANFNNEPAGEIYLLGEEIPDFFLNLTNHPAEDTNPVWPAQCGPVDSPLVAQTTAQVTQLPSAAQFVIGYGNFENNLTPQGEADILKACEELQLECIRNDDLQQLAQQNLPAIVMFSNRWHVQGAWPLIQDILSRGTLLIVLNAETGDPNTYNLSIESDSIRTSLVWMFKEMGDEGQFVYYNFGQNEALQNLIEETLLEYPGIQATAMPADFNDPLTEESIASLVSTNPEIEAIWSTGWQADVFWGLKNSQVQNPPAILCEPRLDMLQSWKERTTENESFRCFSTIQPGSVGYEGVYAAYYLLSGHQVDPAALGGRYGNTFLYDYPVITNDNLDEWLGKLDTLQKGEYDVLKLPPMTPDQIKERWFLE